MSTKPKSKKDLFCFETFQVESKKELSSSPVNDQIVDQPTDFSFSFASAPAVPPSLSTPSKKRTSRKTKLTSDSFFSPTSAPTPSPIHPYAETDYFKYAPPIPEFNYIIDPITLEILIDKTGEP